MMFVEMVKWGMVDQLLFYHVLSILFQKSREFYWLCLPFVTWDLQPKKQVGIAENGTDDASHKLVINQQRPQADVSQLKALEIS